MGRLSQSIWLAQACPITEAKFRGAQRLYLTFKKWAPLNPPMRLHGVHACHVYFYAGLLKSVSNLTVTSINSTTVLISWSPPYTLEGIPILGYNVTITTSGGPNETMSVDGVISMLYYSIDLPDSVKNYTVTIVPINEVGIGECKYMHACINVPV